jgi:hypothetical protein
MKEIPMMKTPTRLVGLLVLTVSLSSAFAASAPDMTQLATALRSEYATKALSALMSDDASSSRISRALKDLGASDVQIERARHNPMVARNLLLQRLGAEQSDTALRKAAGQILTTQLNLAEIIKQAPLNSRYNGVRPLTSDAKISLVRPTSERPGPTADSSSRAKSIEAKLNEVAASGDLDTNVVSEFKNNLATHADLVQSMIGQGMFEHCGMMISKANNNFLLTVNRAVEAKLAGLEVAPAVEQSLVQVTEVDAATAHESRCNLANSCHLYDGEAAANCTI